MRNTRQIAIALGTLMCVSATNSIALADGAKPAWPLQPGDYQGGGSVAPAAQPFQAGDFVGGGGFAVAAKPFQPGDFSGGLESQLAAADSWTVKVGDLTEVINDDSRPADFRGPVQELDIPLVAQGE